MNMLALGLVINEHSVSQFSTVGKIVALANTVLPENVLITPEMTGAELVRVYRSLAPDDQIAVYEKALLDRREVNFLYQEVQFLNQGTMIKEQAADSRVTNMFLTVITVVTVVCFIVMQIYKLNTQAHNDSIDSNFLDSVRTVLIYIIKGLI